ncbi:MAG: flagellar basal-body rod protein FlgF [Bacteroidota bacterium]
MLLRLQNSFTAMDQAVRHQERIANNLANANTNGYRRDRVFVEVLNEEIDAEQAPTSTRQAGQWREDTTGAYQETGNPYDFAVEGDGFFVVSTDEGEPRYTRAGHFVVDGEGTLRTPQGLVVEGQDGPIELGPNDPPPVVNQDGTLMVNGAEVGKLRLVNFDDPQALDRLDGTLFTAQAEPEGLEFGQVRQGFLEGSNVNVVSEMSDMISHLRLFETHQKLMQTLDGKLDRVTRDLGRF